MQILDMDNLNKDYEQFVKAISHFSSSINWLLPIISFGLLYSIYASVFLNTNLHKSILVFVIIACLWLYHLSNMFSKTKHNLKIQLESKKEINVDQKITDIIHQIHGQYRLAPFELKGVLGRIALMGTLSILILYYKLFFEIGFFDWCAN